MRYTINAIKIQFLLMTIIIIFSPFTAFTEMTVKAKKEYVSSTNSIDIDASGKYIVSGGNDGIKIWTLVDGLLFKTLKTTFDFGVDAVAVDPYYKFIVAGGLHDEKLQILRFSDGQVLHEWDQNIVQSIDIDPSGKYIGVGSLDGLVTIYNSETASIKYRINTAFDPGSGGVYSVSFNNSSDLFAAGGYEQIKIYSLKNGALLNTINRPTNGYVLSLAFHQSSKYIIAANTDNTVKIWNVNNGSLINVLAGHKTPVNTVTISPDGKYIFSGSETNPWHKQLGKTIKIWDFNKGTLLRTISGSLRSIRSLSIDKSGKYLISCKGKASYFAEFDLDESVYDSSIDIRDLKTGELIVSLYSLGNQSVCITPEGFFNATDVKVAKNLFIFYEDQQFNIDQFYEKLFRPDLVVSKINPHSRNIVNDSSKDISLSQILKSGPAPKLKIISPKTGYTKSRFIGVSVELADKGGGIGKIIWKINDSTIHVDESKKDMNGSSIKIKRNIVLTPGENLVEIIAYNSSNEIASTPVELYLEMTGANAIIPKLYILGIAINKYNDKDLELKNAVYDSQSIVRSLSSMGKYIFKEIYPIEIYDQDATRNGIERSFHNIAKKATEDDVFIFFIAGHGHTNKGRYYFFPVDFRYHNDDSFVNAIDDNMLFQLITKIKARKSLILIDTCHSGAFINTQLYTRGIEHKMAIKKLARAIGRATIAASDSLQSAYEDFNNHGIFTFSVLEAFKVADDRMGNKDGFISTVEIASYVAETVPKLSYKKNKKEQVPQYELFGMSFPVGVVYTNY